MRMYRAVLAVAVIPVLSAAARPLPDLKIAVSDGRSQVRPGDRLDFTVKLRNNEARAVPATVRVQLPVVLAFVSGDKGAVAAGNTVTWKARLSPAGRTELRFTANVGEMPKGYAATAMAATACALPEGDPQPIVCATDMDPLPGAATPSGAGGPAAVAGALALAALAAAGAGWWLVRRRKRKSDAPGGDATLVDLTV